MTHFRPCLPLLAACAATHAPAAEPRPAPDQTIVVRGERLDREKLRKEASAFVRSIGVAPGEVPAARWIDPLCLRLVGLDGKIAERTLGRLRMRAAEAGARLAHPQCDANVVIAFTLDGADLITRLRRKTSAIPKLPEETRGIVSPRPVRWWYATETRHRDGMRGSEAELPWIAGDGPRRGSPIPNAEGGGNLAGYSGSLVSTMAKRALTHAVVIVDVPAAEGVTLDALADYLAFIVLAQVRGDASASKGSILSLFAGKSSLRAMTARDRAFLRTLYTMPLDRTGFRHRQQLIGGMVRAAGEDAR